VTTFTGRPVFGRLQRLHSPVLLYLLSFYPASFNVGYLYSVHYGFRNYRPCSADVL